MTKSKFGKAIEILLWIAALGMPAENLVLCRTPVGNPTVPEWLERKEKIMKPAITTLLAMAALAAAVVWVFPMKHGVSVLPVVHAQNENGRCSLASLNGPYAVEGQGTIVASLGAGFPAPPFPFGEASLARFNGDGTGSASATVDFGGVVLNAVPVTITYTVNTDCTGTLTVSTGSGLTIHQAIVLIRGGQRVVTTQTDPWAVVQRRAEKLGD